jgi:hypothetical protein
VKELRAQTQQLVEAHDKLSAHMQALQDFKNTCARAARRHAAGARCFCFAFGVLCFPTSAADVRGRTAPTATNAPPTPPTFRHARRTRARALARAVSADAARAARPRRRSCGPAPAARLALPLRRQRS